MTRKRKTFGRRQFLVQAGMAGAFFATTNCARIRVGRAIRPPKPSIILLLGDDHRWNLLGCMGNHVLRTPNLDNLAARGVVFENNFVTTSICAASRASIFAGQFLRTHGYDFDTAPLTVSAWEQTYPVLLRRAGYRTGFIGKFGVEVEGCERGLPVETFDYWKGFGGQGRYFQPGEKKHLTNVMGDQAVEFLQGCSKTQPFCLSVSFKAPHVQDEDKVRPFPPDPALEELYKDVTIPVPRTADARFFEALPEFVRTSECRVRWEVRFSTPEKYQANVKDHYRLITGIDIVVGRILAALKELGLDDNAILIYSSDNGFFLGERGLAGKWLMYEESIRTPLIICDPVMPARMRGQRLRKMTLNIDLAPTVLDLAGVAPPARMQGRSLVALLDGKADRWRDDFFYEHLLSHPRIPKCEGVRTERWKYFRYFEQAPVHEELYDLRSDPEEVKNLVNDGKHRTMLETLRKRCDELRDCLGGRYVRRERPAKAFQQQAPKTAPKGR